LEGASRVLRAWLIGTTLKDDQESVKAGISMGRTPGSKPAVSERVMVAASGFTSLWAVAWMGAGAMPVSAALQGGLAVGSVMAGSGLTMLWWKTRAMSSLLADAGDDGSEDAEEDDEDGDKDDADSSSPDPTMGPSTHRRRKATPPS
jgi:hypothetical protein